MANETPRMKITYPALGESNYFDNYQAGMNDIDAGIFATWSAINTIVSGGGTVDWDLAGSDYTLTWTAPIAFQTPAFGSAQSVASDSIIIPAGLLIYTDLSYGATVGSTALTFTAATQAPVDTAASVFAWHNPTTHSLHFATGLVLVLGASATGVQPQGGGGGGSISVTDGSTTVNPASTITMVGATVANLGGGNAEITVTGGGGAPTDAEYLTLSANGTLTDERVFTSGYGIQTSDAGAGSTFTVAALVQTKFVVDQNGNGSHTQIFKAVQDAYGEYLATGLDQVVFVRGGTYTETIVFYDGVTVVAEASPQALDAKADFPFEQVRALASAVIVEGQGHTFEPVGGQIRCTIRGIVFSSSTSASAALLVLDNTTSNPRNKIAFVDCFFASNSSGAIWEQNGKDTPDVEVSFCGCKFHWQDGTGGGYNPMFYFGSNGNEQYYLFTDCDFFAKYTGKMVFRSNSGAGLGEVKITRCKFYLVDIDSGAAFGNALIADLSLTDVLMQQPERYCVSWNNTGTIYTYGCCTLEAQFGYEAVNSSGPIIYSALFTIPWSASQAVRNVTSSVPIAANYVMPYRAVEGTTHLETAAGFTLDLEAFYLSGSTITNVSWDTSVGGAGVRTVDLHNAAYTQGMYVTIWDSGGSGGSNNISVTSINSTGGAIGPHTTIQHNDGSLTFVATLDSSYQPCWRSISYFH